MSVKAKLEQALASDTAYGESVGLTLAARGGDIRGIQVKTVGEASRGYRRGPIVAE